MTAPLIPVSWGELLDKITILEIKVHRLRDASAAANAARELALLRHAAGHVAGFASGLAECVTALRAVNTRLWRLEDQVRDCESTGAFGPEFVMCARAIYRENDERGRIKRAINRTLGSALVEEKQHPRY